MEPTIFRFVLRHSKKEQILLLLFTLFAFPFLYLSLDLPKTIINEGIGGSDFPRLILGYELDQIPYLLVLCGIFLMLVFINGGFKYFINVYRGVVGERMLRRLRYDLFHRMLRFPLPHFRRVSQGEVVSMIVSETEPLGGYIGDSVALPAFQGGTLVTILVFMFVQNPILGTAAIVLYPIQAWLIPKLQRRVNQLKKQRTIRVRRLSERIGEVVAGIRDVHTHDTSQYELAEYSERIGKIYEIRYQIYRQKFFIKFLNNFIAQVTPFFFFSIGGYLVINGSLSFGALVAVLAAYKDLSSPWKELLNFYQIQEDARNKYELLVDAFQRDGLLEVDLLERDTDTAEPATGELVATNVDLTDEDEGDTTFSGNLTFKTTLPTSLAVVGPAGSGKDRLAFLLAGLKRPESGSVNLGGMDLTMAPESIMGRQFAYVGQETPLASGTLRDNLLYSLKHRPTREPAFSAEQRAERDQKMHEALLSGNSKYDITWDWNDYQSAGVTGPEGLLDRCIEVLQVADMDRDIYQVGLHGKVDLKVHPDIPERILEARRELRDRLQDPEVAALVELFDRDRYNTNMSVAENLLFGTPDDESFNINNLAGNAYVRKVLYETDLMDDFLKCGRKVAEITVDLFADLPPGSDLFEQFSFISAEDLPEFRSLLARTSEDNINSLSDDDRSMLMSLPFRLIVARHRLGVIDADMQARLLEARGVLSRGFGSGKPPIKFFDRDDYNPMISIQDNILFGRMAYGKARSEVRIGELIGEVVEQLNLKRVVMEVGFDYQVGVAGSRLTAAQRQKLAIARCVLKRPDVLIVDHATAGLEESSQQRILENLKNEFADRTLIWVVHRASLGREFDYAIVMEGGRVVGNGSFDDLNTPGSLLNQLVGTN